MPRRYILNLRLQDSKVPELRMEELHSSTEQNFDIPSNLSRPDFEVVISPEVNVRPKKVIRSNDTVYDYRFSENSPAFDWIQVFFVTDYVVRGFKHFYKAAMGEEFSVIDRRGRKLRIFPHFKLKDNEKNAEYDPRNHEIHFSFYRGRGGQTIQLCDTSDIIAHEVGHALLSVANERLSASRNLEQRALHEAFGDLCAVAFLIDAPAMLQKALKFTEGNLMRHCFLNILAEQFGQDLGQPRGLRVLSDDTVRRSTVNQNPHALSTVFSSGIYRFFVKTYESRRTDPDFTGLSPHELITQTYMAIATVVTGAMLRADTHATFASIVTDIMHNLNMPADRKRIQQEFIQREVLSSEPSEAFRLPVFQSTQGTLFRRGDDASAAGAFQPMPHGIQHHGSVHGQDALSGGAGSSARAFRPFRG